MTGRIRALLRLFAVQGSWNYERMLGVGMGYAAEPLLDDLALADPARHAEATVRSAEFFNSHPYLAGLALGATVRAEYDGVPGAQIARLRTALCSPLGALGDQLFWAGILPGMLGLTVIAVGMGAGWWPVPLFLVVYNAVRLYVAVWALRTGMEAGMHVGAAISQSRLPVLVGLAGAPAAFLIGAAAAPAVRWVLGPLDALTAASVCAIAAAGMALGRLAGPRFAAPKFALMALGATLLIRWMIR